MAEVYAADPSSAFAMNAQLDQQRVANFLNSIQANRSAQQSGWEAAMRMDAARQAAEQHQETMMAHLAAQRQAADQFAQSLGMSHEQLAELVRSNQAKETYQTAALGRENASLLAEHNRMARETDAHNEEASNQQKLADALNQRNVLLAFKARLEPAGVATAEAAATGEGFSPTGDPAYSNKWFFHGAPRAKRTAEVMQNIASEASGLPADFSGATSLTDYADVVKKAIDKRVENMPNPASIKNLHTFVTTDESGNYRPLLTPKQGFNVAAPNPLLPGGTEAGAPMGPPAALAPGRLAAMLAPGAATRALAPTAAAQPSLGASPAHPSLKYFRDEAEVRAAGLPPGATFMIWDAEKKLFRPARIKP